MESESKHVLSGRKLGLIMLTTGTVIFALSYSVVQKLIELGSENLVEGRNPISFCNILFAGNTIAAVALAGIFHRDIRSWKTRDMDLRNWVTLVSTASLEGVVGPMFIILALEETSVIGVVLVQSFQIPLLLLLGWLLYREVPNRFSAAGALVAMLGVILMVGLKPVFDGTGFSIGGGEAKALLASLAFVVATQFRRHLSREFPVGLYPMIRALVGGIAFAAIVLSFFGPSHFMDVASPFLWRWMVVYGLLIVVAGQITWHISLRSVKSSELCIAESFLPVLGLVFAFLLLGQKPNLAEWIGGGVILVGVFLTLRGSIQKKMTREIPIDRLRREGSRKGQGFSGI